LLALILLTEARAATRLTADGEQVTLADADRRRWDHTLVAEGLALLPDRAGTGPLALQAAIAAEHARARSLAATNWARMVELYDALLTIEPSATIALGRCVAVSYLAGPATGLADLDEVLALGGLDRYPYAHAARAQLLDRLGRDREAAVEWARAAACGRSDAEREYFAARA
jgi:RNA polymerase sigma-70 factor (ECF subfamily)